MRKAFVGMLLALCSVSAVAQEKYFLPAGKEAVSPDAEGFIRRWTILEPISKTNRSNTVFVDSYLRDVFAHEYFKNQMTILPKDGQKVKVTFDKQVEQPRPAGQPTDFRRMSMEPPKFEKATEELKWHKLDSKTYNLKLLRFGEHEIKRVYGVIYWVVTVINCEEEMKDVRLSVGSNSASQWWVNGQDVLLLSGDRRMVADDCMSHRITLKKGENIIRGAIINGPGMSDFCVKIVDENGKAVKGGYTIK
ncbi:MAG: acetylxylan esterase [Bacteroidales bacterium]|nr:acetylxylan esterase [Bacteroidales bacterium]